MDKYEQILGQVPSESWSSVPDFAESTRYPASMVSTCSEKACGASSIEQGMKCALSPLIGG